MKKSAIISIVIFIVIIGFCVFAITESNKRNNLISNKTPNTNQNQSNNPSPSVSESKMTDDQLIQSITSGEQLLTLDTPENDTTFVDIDTVLNEKDPLVEMPGQ